MEDLYMNGRGVVRRAEELREKVRAASDAMWAAIDAAFLGGVLAMLSVGGSVAAIVAGSLGAPMALIALPFCAVGAVYGIRLIIPWMDAGRRVKEAGWAAKQHGDKCKAETAKHGRGWARS